MQGQKFVKVWFVVWVIGSATYWSGWLAYKWWNRVTRSAEQTGYFRGFDDGLKLCGEEKQP